MAIKSSIVLRNAEQAGGAPLFNSGKLRLYAGSQPATPETAASGTMLVELTFGATAFPAPVAGVLTANAITSGTIAASGTAGWARAWQSDGTTALMDGDVGTSGAWINLNSVVLSAGATLGISALTITAPT